MPTIAILLSAYNGAVFLPEQLASIQNQTYPNWCLYVIDDGSTDNTRALLETCTAQWGDAKIQIRTQTNQGCTASFLELASDPTIQADYYAYCDHDDIWEAHKLENALRILETKNQAIPQLYCSATQLMDAAGKGIGHSSRYTHPPCFQHALVQNIASGNTMLFNACTKKYLAALGKIDIPIHDWWTYILVTAYAGEVYYDTNATVQYRQHAHNLIGHKKSFFTQLTRVFKDTFSTWNTQHIQALEKIKNTYPLPENTIKILEAFKKARQGPFLKRFYWFWKSGVYRQTTLETTKLYLACLLHKI
jgi:glycosyltransferase involved in cell wall biosynthesis